MMKYRISNLAQQDLEDIWFYTVDEWSLEQAEKYISGLLSCFEGLAEGNVIGKPVDYVRKGYKKALYGKHYIFYRTATDKVIEIIRVLHMRMDVESRL
ncbi:type II toxin-antitoxin system RelE/ParE family toxin [Runella zeae]|uniref:type II toxin-antitoxin system RelE/ParE family toxin n=1 Tax=Runella zeae TaxID=94255 RepID=UPI002356B7F0|nr:type II toxin-antitoxin system RelE/ParE family toxin [Runella zeae]